MLLQGQFRNIDNELFTVKILSDGDSSTTRTIGENGLFFGEDPVIIETDCDDSFEHIIRKSCTINLVCSDYIGDVLYANNSRSIVVNILKGNEVVFAGYVEPNTFNQPFAKPLEEFTINATDALSTLQYYKYKNCTLNNYDTIKTMVGTVSFKDILEEMFDDIMDDLDISGSYTPLLIYDCSKGVEQGDERTIFSDLAISDSYIMGEEFDDCLTNEEILENILKYLNLHILQVGFDFWIFDWNTLRNKRNVWWDILNLSVVDLANPSTITFTSAMHGADDTNITVDDVFNQVSVKCSLENEDVVIESPLDKKSIVSVYNGRQLYCREYYAEADKKTNIELESFWRMLQGTSLDPTWKYDKAKIVDWYMQAIYNPHWKMHLSGGMGDITEQYQQNNNGEYVDQWSVPKYVKDNRLTPSLFRFGKTERDALNTNNEPKGKVSMTDYLYISINGNDIDSNTNSQPNPVQLEAHSPMIEFVGGNGGGTYSPSDDDTINYLVFSGKIQLQSLQQETQPYHTLWTDICTYPTYDANHWTRVCLERGNGYVDTKDVNHYDTDPNDYKGRLYTRKFYTFEKPSSTYIDENDYMTSGVSLQPPAESKLKLYHYHYSKEDYHGNEDLISKVPILECELIIGNKRLIETEVDEYGNSVFEWVTIGQEPTFVYDDDDQTYAITTFTLGFNPKTDDYVIGNEYNIQNTVTPSMNLDVEGTAIPIKKDDYLSGAVQFRILGPCNTTWNQIIRKHPTWFRHTSWFEYNKIILAHLENIILSNFEAKIVSDNAGTSVIGDNKDLIYMSDETDKFINKKDDVDFDFITQLTSAEAVAKGVKQGLNINAVLNSNDGSYITSIYNATTQETAKAEEHYVDQYYTEYSSPKLKIEATMHDDNKIDWRYKYYSSVLDRNFIIQSINKDLKYNNATITFKEV